jgi:glycosyltransferase involved in cell wall biosynthesis
MRILHVNGSARLTGGVETYLADLVSAQSCRGDSVGLLASDDSTDFSVNAFQSVSAGEVTVREFVTRFQADVVHIHDACLPIAIEEELRRDHPTVDFFHDFSFACASGEHYFRDGTACNRSHGRGCLLNLVFRGCAHRSDLRGPISRYRELNRRLPVLREATAIVASRYMRSVAIGNGLASSRCHVIPYFTQRPATPPPPSDGAAVAFVGRISSGKGLDTLLRSLALVQGEWERLLVSGDGWALSEARNLSTRLGLHTKVSFLGWCGREEIRDILREAQVVVVPSRWPEPFGLVGIEAMAQARPVIASRVGGIQEWLDDGETGLVVEAGDERSLARAIDTLLADPDRASAMGREGWQRVGRFSPAAHLAGLDTVYEDALSERAGESQDAPRSPTVSVHG